MLSLARAASVARARGVCVSDGPALTWECGRSWRHVWSSMGVTRSPSAARANIPTSIDTALNQLSQVMHIDFDELLAGYMDPSGGSFLRQWLS